MTLAGFWFLAIAILWTGFFVLEGFDFGVGILHGYIGRDDVGRSAVVGTVGPLWDGNEVWLIVAGAAMFAAFPDWYATMFSAFYLALTLILAALIVRGIAFVFRDYVERGHWLRTWDVLMTVGSVIAPLVIGIALGNLLSGVPINSSGEFTGTFWDLFRPYPVFVGITFVVLCVLHGATFIALKTSGELHDRAESLAQRGAGVAALFVLVFAFWTHATAGRGVIPSLTAIGAVMALIGAIWLARDGLDGWAFAATTFAMATTVLSIFVDLNPRVMVSSTNSAYDLTVSNSSSGSYALKLITIVLAIFLPLVIAYQSYTYYVFRKRLRREDYAGEARPPKGEPAAAPST